MKVLCPPLADVLRQLYAETNTEFVIVSPWIKNNALQYVIGQDSNKSVHCRVLTVGNLGDFLNGSSDVTAIEWFLQIGADVRLVSNLHAKVYIADQTHAIVTSANLTLPGLENNLELGVLVDNVEEVISLTRVVEEWFSRGKCVDIDWLNLMQQNLNSNQPARGDLQRIEHQLRQAGNQLRGKKIPLPKPKLPVKKVIGEWGKKIKQWHYIKSNPKLAQEFVRFFELTFKWLPDKTLRKAWFGVHSDRISLTVGNIWLASVWAVKPKQSIWLLVDNAWDDFASSTQKYTPLGWKISSWEQVTELNQSLAIWKSYAAAAEKIWNSPISRNVIPKNLVNKRKVCDLLGIIPLENIET